MNIITTIRTNGGREVIVGKYSGGDDVVLDVREPDSDRFIPSNLTIREANELVAALIEALGDDYAGAAVPADPEPPQDEGGAEATFYIDRERLDVSIPGVGSFDARYEFVGA